MGERYDARRELGPWHPRGGRAGATTRGSSPSARQPIRVTEELAPVAVTERAPGVHVFDLGQNMVGWVRLAVEGERGTRVQLRFAEMLEPDGSLYLDEPAQRAPARHLRPARRRAARSFEPRFTFHGFRYVEVTRPRRRLSS